MQKPPRFRKAVEIENLTKVVVEPNWDKLKDESILVRDIRNSIKEDNDPPAAEFPVYYLYFALSTNKVATHNQMIFLKTFSRFPMVPNP